VDEARAADAQEFARGQEIGRFNMGSTVVALFGREAAFAAKLGPGSTVRLGQPMARIG